MAKLIYCAITSLDGFVEDADGNFDWCIPDEEVHTFVNELERPIGTYLYGRRLYDVLVGWQTMPLEDASPANRDFAELWRAADKIVYSTTLESPSTPKTRIERDFRTRHDPAAEGRRRSRPHRRGREPCGAGNRGRAGRRDPPAHVAAADRRRQGRTPGRTP